jgi:hypothetical protein
VNAKEASVGRLKQAQKQKIPAGFRQWGFVCAQCSGGGIPPENGGISLATQSDPSLNLHSFKSQSPIKTAAPDLTVGLAVFVAGVGFEPTTFGL